MKWKNASAEELGSVRGPLSQHPRSGCVTGNGEGRLYHCSTWADWWRHI